jgi:hypothetical protein
MAKPAAHTWTFFRSGGFDQVSLTTAADIAAVPRLDLKLWAALACPVKGLEFDERTLELIDSDKDGRVRASEIISAITFVIDNLKDLASLIPGSDKLPLAAINDATESGKVLLACARHILGTQGKTAETMLALEDVAKAVESFSKTPFNGDGIVPAEAAEDLPTRELIADIIATHGAEPDRNGQVGINQKRLDAFFVDLAAYSGWWKVAEERGAEVLPLGAATLTGLAAFDAVAAKIDDYFARTSLAAYDARAQAALNRQEKDYLDIASRDLAITSEEIRRFPLAPIHGDRPLPLGGHVNPAWAAALAAFAAQVAAPMLGAGKQTLSEGEWADLKARFAPARAWIAAKAGAAVERLGLPRVRELLAGDGMARVQALITRDLSFEREFGALIPVEKLVRLHRDLYRLLHNFVNFADFYSRDRMAVFQAGVLYLDTRACELVVRVDDMAKHGALAGLSKTYLAYCECVRPASGEKMTIAAGFTAGDSDHLLVGRNGIFYDRKGRDWDATIIKVVENPISIRQAFWAPYKRAIRFVEELVAKRAAAAESESTTKLTSGIEQVAKTPEPGKPPENKPKIDLSVIAALGVAVGGVAGALSGFFLAFFGLGVWMPLGVIAIFLAVSGPSMIIAALKLRQRNLGPILDASGWAVNGRVLINIPFGGSLTELAHLPANSHRTLRDPYAEKPKPWWLYITLGVLLLIGGGLVWDRLHHDAWIWSRLSGDNEKDVGAGAAGATGKGGKDGKDGTDGTAGKDGKDGKDGTAGKPAADAPKLPEPTPGK